MTIIQAMNFTQISTNAAPETASPWQSGQSYQADDRVQYAGKVYTCVSNIKSTQPPNLAIKEWVETGNPNPTRYMDKFINTQTMAKTNQPLEIEIQIDGWADSFALFNVDGAKVYIHSENETNTIFSKSMVLRDEVASWWQYFYGKSFSYRNDVWFLGDKEYTGKFFIVIEPNEKGASLGHFVIGKKAQIGETEAKFELKTLDFSKINQDAWGNTHIVQGKTAKYADVNVIIPTRKIDHIKKTLERASKPTLFIGDERENGFESLAILGYYDDFTISSENFTFSQLKLSIKGVI